MRKFFLVVFLLALLVPATIRAQDQSVINWHNGGLVFNVWSDGEVYIAFDTMGVSAFLSTIAPTGSCKQWRVFLNIVSASDGSLVLAWNPNGC